MKKLLTTLLLVASIQGSLSIQAADPVIRNMGESKYCLETGDLSMTIDAAAGGKILSFKHKDTEVISQSPMREAFGSTFWTSPQQEWNWPPVAEYDKLPYTVEQTHTSLVMIGQVSKKHQYRVRKEFKVDAEDNAMVITYFIINESDETRRVAPWEITRVPNEGLIFFDAAPEAITPDGLIPFTQGHGVSWYQTDVHSDNRKINADGKGWLAYAAGSGLLLVKKFPDLEVSQPAPAEAEIQVYVNSGKTYIELESQGAYTELKPGESLSYTVRWYLMPVNCEPVPSQQLLSKVRSVIN